MSRGVVVGAARAARRLPPKIRKKKRVGQNKDYEAFGLTLLRTREASLPDEVVAAAKRVVLLLGDRDHRGEPASVPGVDRAHKNILCRDVTIHQCTGLGYLRGKVPATPCQNAKQGKRNNNRTNRHALVRDSVCSLPAHGSPARPAPKHVPPYWWEWASGRERNLCSPQLRREISLNRWLNRGTIPGPREPHDCRDYSL